jgi:electron transfer flavoprotein alpha/beta subunit
MGAKSKPLQELTLADLELSPADVAPTQRVGAIEPAPQKGPGEVVQGDAAVGRVADLLAAAKVI